MVLPRFQLMVPLSSRVSQCVIILMSCVIAVSLSGCLPSMSGVSLPTTNPLPGEPLASGGGGTQTQKATAGTGATVAEHNPFLATDQALMTLSSSVVDPFLIALPNDFKRVTTDDYEKLSPFAKALIASHTGVTIAKDKLQEALPASAPNASLLASGTAGGSMPSASGVPVSSGVSSLSGLLGTSGTVASDGGDDLEVSGIMYGNGHPMAVLRSGGETNFGGVGDTVRINGASFKVKHIASNSVTVSTSAGKQKKLQIAEILGYEPSSASSGSNEGAASGGGDVASMLSGISNASQPSQGGGTVKPSKPSGAGGNPKNMEDINKLVDSLLK